MTRRDIPNLITMGRILLVWPLVTAMLDGRFGLALILFAVAGLSDGIDGFLARRNAWFTRLGAVLDPLADKLLLVSVYLSLGVAGLLPLWLVAFVIARDVIIVGGAISYRILFGSLEMAPTFLSKFNTLLQISLVLTVMLQQLQMVPAGLSETLLYAVLASTIFSGLHYAVVWGRRALSEYRRVGGLSDD